MRRFSLLALAPLFAFLFTLPASAQNPSVPVVEGTLVGHDGTPMQQAHVRVEAPDLGRNVKLRVEAAADDGSFRVPIDTTGIIILRFTGTNHQAKEIVTYAPPGETIGINVRLRTPSYARPFSSLRLTGTFNDFSKRAGTRPMSKQPDGTFAETVPAPGDSLSYQILGAASTLLREMPVDTVVFDGFGYRSVVPTPKDSVQIRLDPDKLVRGDGKTQVEFRDSTTIAAQYADFIADLRERVLTFRQQMRSAKSKSARRNVAATFDWTPSKTRLQEALKHEHPASVKHAIRVGYVVSGVKLNSKEVQQILNEVPPSFSGWVFTLDGYGPGRGPISEAIRQSGQPEAYLSYAYEAIRTQPNDELKSDVLTFLLQRAKENGNEARQQTLYTWLQTEYSNTFAARIAARNLNPNKTKLKPGQPVPDFSVQGLRDSTRTFTPADFEEQYLLLDFWATWCGPCIEAFPTLRKAHEAKGELLTILSIAVDRERLAVTEFLSDHALPWQHAYAGGGLVTPSKIVEQFRVRGLPTYVLVGPDGKIVAKKMPHEGDPLPKILDRVSSAASSGDGSSGQ